MISRSRRLRAAQVVEVMRRGRTLRGHLLSAKVLGTVDGTIRFAAVVPKAIAKKAHERNRLRRALYKAADRARVRPALPAGAHVALLLRTIPAEPLASAFLVDIERLFPAAIKH